MVCHGLAGEGDGAEEMRGELAVLGMVEVLGRREEDEKEDDDDGHMEAAAHVTVQGGGCFGVGSHGRREDGESHGYR